MICELCRQPAPGNVCTRPHDALAVARWCAKNVDGDGYRRQSSPRATSNVEYMDGGDGVTFVVHGVRRDYVVRWYNYPLPADGAHECRRLERRVEVVPGPERCTDRLALVGGVR